MKERYGMRKEQKQIVMICIFLIIGGILGYFVAANQIKQLSDPAYIAFWTEHNMPVPAPLGYAKGIISFALLFSGMPAGWIFYNELSQKWLTSRAPKILIGIIMFPIYTCIGAVGAIPFVLYKGICLFRKTNRSSAPKT